MNPQMYDGNGKERIEAGGAPLPADDQAAVLVLEPGKRPLGLVARDSLFYGAPTWLAVFPHAFGDLRANPSLTKAPAEVSSIIPSICGQDLRPLARAAPLTSADVEAIQQREDLGPLVPIRGCCACGERHASGICETVHQDAFAFAAIGDPLTPALARGKTNSPPRRTATESSRVPRRVRGGARAWRPRCHQPASAVTTDGRHSWRPIGDREGDHTSGSQ